MFIETYTKTSVQVITGVVGGFVFSLIRGGYGPIRVAIYAFILIFILSSFKFVSRELVPSSQD